MNRSRQKYIRITEAEYEAMRYVDRCAAIALARWHDFLMDTKNKHKSRRGNLTSAMQRLRESQEALYALREKEEADAA